MPRSTLDVTSGKVTVLLSRSNFGSYTEATAVLF